MKQPAVGSELLEAARQMPIARDDARAYVVPSDLRHAALDVLRRRELDSTRRQVVGEARFPRQALLQTC